MNEFARLFKKYRLRAEFETFSAFGDALADKGYYYEDSIFSHWQKGTRIPSNREVLLSIIKIFVERDAIRTIEEANEFLSSVGLGYLTDSEKSNLFLDLSAQSPFQVPNEIAHFTGRDELTKKIQKAILHGKAIVLNGAPGIGKTALAIRLGHALKDAFPDGVLWYKVDSSNVMDILLSIASLFGEDISEIKDSAVRASIVRTLLAKKKVLLIFDNVTTEDRLHLLLPNTSSCGVIFSSRDSVLPIDTPSLSIPVHIFTDEEVLTLFKKVFDAKYVTKNKKCILKISDQVGNLPLAVNLAATHMKQFEKTPDEYLRDLKENTVDLHTLKYEDKSLLQTLTLGFNSLNPQTQNVFLSLGIFEGKDFSGEAMAAINKMSLRKTESSIQQLVAISFIERSKEGRYRIHPLLKQYARERITDTSVYLQAATYYEQLLISAEQKQSYRLLGQEVDNIIFVFKKCYDHGYWDKIITLWNPVEKFLSDTNEIKKLKLLTETIDTAPRVSLIQNLMTVIIISFIIWWLILAFLFQGPNLLGQFYSFGYSSIFLIGGLVGIFRSKSWGFFTTNIGKAIVFISAGTISWCIGNTIWAYYNFFQKIEIPYPSLADAGFAPSYFFWIAGIFYLSKATGAKFVFQRSMKKLFLLVIPLALTYFSFYFLFFMVDRSYASEAPLRIFFDVYYPLMDIIILSLAFVIFGLSVNFFGGKYKLSVYALLAAVVFMYLGDFLFSYLTSTSALYTGGITDVFFSIAIYLFTWGTLSFYLTPKRDIFKA